METRNGAAQDGSIIVKAEDTPTFNYLVSIYQKFKAGDAAVTLKGLGNAIHRVVYLAEGAKERFGCTEKEIHSFTVLHKFNGKEEKVMGLRYTILPGADTMKKLEAWSEQAKR